MGKVNATIELISPVHIGSGEELSPLDFVYDGKRFIRVNLDKVIELVDDIEWLTSMLSHGSIEEVLKKARIPLEKVMRYSIPSLGNGDIKKVREHIKRADDMPIIPGSSLKGAIRTSLLRIFELSSKADEIKTNIVKSRNKGKGELKKLKQSAAKPLEKSVFIGEKGREKSTMRQGTSESNYDIMRALQISDITFSLKDLCLIPVKVASKEGGRIKWKQLPRRSLDSPEQATTIWVEALRPGAKAAFTIKWDEDILERFDKELGLNPEVVSLVNFKANLDPINIKVAIPSKKRERRFWESYPSFSFYKDTLKIFKGYITLRLAWGSGFLDMTVTEKYGDELIEEVRKAFYKRSHPGNFPKTRRVAFKDNKPWMPFGWVRIKLQE